MKRRKDPTFPNFLQPLYEKGLLQSFTGKAPGLAKKGTKAATNTPLDIHKAKNINQDFNAGYQNLPASQQELSAFILAQLANSHNFKGVKLYDSPLTSNDAIPGAYDFQNKDLYFNRVGTALQGKINPVVTLMHEGTHGLDDLNMKTYQKGAMDFLAKHIKPPISEDRGDWYTGAQNILARGDKKSDFLQKYPFKPADGYGIPENIIADFQDYEHLHKRDVPEFSTITYNDIKKGLNTSRNAGENISPKSYIHPTSKKEIPYSGDDFQFSQLSEFPAFFMENIDGSLPVAWGKTPQGYEVANNNNMGRKFLKKIAKDVYRNFNELDPKFQEKYPHASTALQNRIFDLRNYNKYPNANDYLQRFNQKRFPSSSISTPFISNSTFEVPPEAPQNPVNQMIAPQIPQEFRLQESQQQPYPYSFGAPTPLQNQIQNQNSAFRPFFKT